MAKKGRLLLILLVGFVCLMVWYTLQMKSQGLNTIDEQMSYSRPGTSHRITDFFRGIYLTLHNNMKTKAVGSFTRTLMTDNLPDDYEDFFKTMVALEANRWTHNFTSIQQFRNELSEFSELDDLRSHLIATKESIRPGDYVKSFKSIRSVKVTEELWQMFSNHSIFNGPRFRKCNIVGSGGILLNSKCGKIIDDSDLVFRFNLPTMKNYSDDVGTKSSYLTVNPSAVTKWLNGLDTYKGGESTLSEVSLEHNGHALISAFDVSYTIEYAMQIFRIRTQQPCKESYFLNPKHILTYRHFWQNAGMDQEISSGLYITSAAIDICDEVHLYGFWPFTVSTRGHRVPYHYYDKLKSASFHNLDQEYRILVRMHEMGLVKLQLGPCL